MSYQVVFSKKSLKSFTRLPKSIQLSIANKLKVLAKNPFAANNNIKKLQGEEDCYRLRVADYRVLYRIENLKLIIEVINIAHRKEVYR